MGTLLIRSGRIIDGTGREPFDGNILIRDDAIADVIPAQSEPPPADAMIDAAGCIVSPGFIDMHSHSDWVLPLSDHHILLACLLEQGITTVVAGNCGFSPAPYNPHASASFSALTPLLERPLDYTWRTMGQFLDTLEEYRPAVNIAELVGHSTVRIACARTRRGVLTRKELATSLDAVRKAFDEGAWGLSFGLGYDPGMFSPLEEIEAFCRVASDYSRPVTVHLKALSVLSPTYPLTTIKAHNLLALKEMIDIAGKTGVRLQLSHFIFVGRRSWGSSKKALKMVEKARSRGVDVMFDAFPYACGNTTVNVVLPFWFLAKTPQAYRNRISRAHLKAELEAGFALLGFTYRDFQVMHPAVAGAEDLIGLTIPQIAEKWGMPPFDAYLRLSEESRGSALMLFHAYSGEPGRQEVIERVLSHELCMFETDAVIRSTGYPNPAAKGTFPRILGPLVRDRKLFSLEQAVNRSTLACAQRFGIADRGRIAKGMAADIVIFDPSAVSDTPPEGVRPAGRPRGILHVLLNGRHVVRDGVYTGETRCGRVLRA
ncbi:MAG: amidohydrolase family protein [Bacteriovoracaceae bacterium]|jgi:N-acyl-D-amino-acid deacylase|nr:amidohydrolase family protein [Bacteriovoracaceae bacterium]HNR50487.1 amidohydrolase family protein [Deltaproteobacteria bacterium]HRR19843.1 amidohydrolase family protein [Desulfomonilia bacterium]HON60481.1 amidohydrolase family protein [Deltaproteobacteria bacterium]HPV29552.1 amidohydrolase family protein [Deltaproteobacteria bacterium]